MMTGKTFTNSLGMRFVRIEPGTFRMGNDEPLPDHLVRLPNRRCGDSDERPAHRVTISRPFYLGACEVTNAQFEEFDPSHGGLRGKARFSKEDDEAVVFVRWFDAVAFCEWLSRKEGLPHRLPTEAEWEYACRAGTTTPFHTGDALPEAFHKNARMSWYPDPHLGQTEKDLVPLTVGQTPPNAWGLYDMHGNVEEWCLDWYGPYDEHDQTDPVGLADGNFRVTRGGSHSTELYYLRSSNRMGTLPEERSWLIGFRVLIGELPQTKPSPMPPRALHEREVRQEAPSDLPERPDLSKPYFKGPRVYMRIPPGSDGPIFSHHNHVPAVVACPNGDILAIWYTCREEPGREVATAASRLRVGAEEWEPTSLFWDAPDRNDHASALWLDERGTIYHFVGLSVAATWGNLATIMRTSQDNGATWSKARFIIPEHGARHMPITSVIRTRDGALVLPCDAVTGGEGGTALWISDDEGVTWRDAGGTIAGIHAGVVQLRDGRLLAFGRGDTIDGKMPMSISADMGARWTYQASPFPPIHMGQRLSLLRLREGPVFFASFANEPMAITDASGKERTITGLYCAVSFDECRTWLCRRPVSDDGPERLVETMDGYFRPMSRSHSEPAGYLAACQAADDLIHLVSSRNHYVFNLAWLATPPPALE